MTRRLAAFGAALLLGLVLPVSAYARAGGGHSSGGGSSSSGSSHSSGGSSSSGSSGGTSGGTSGGSGTSSGGTGTPLGPLGTALLVGFFVLFGTYWIYTKVRGRDDGGAQPAGDFESAAAAERMASDVQVAQTGVAAIRANDPGFDQDAFLDRASRTFLLAQQAWSDRNLAAVRPFMGQGTYLSWESQLGQMERRHEKDVMQDVAVTNRLIVRAVRGPYEHITVRFEARAIDYTIDDRTGAVLTGSKSAEPFTEYWTFERSGTTTTLGKAGVLEQKCPNCGAPLSINAIGECTYCKAAVTNGTYDWVLQRIDQADYWNRSIGGI